MSSDDQPTPLTTPEEDAERIRNKRLAKLQAAASASSSASPSGSSTPAPTAGSSSEVQKPTAPVPSPGQTTPAKPSPKIFRPAESSPSPARVISPASKPKAPAKFDLNSWEHDAIGHILKVTLDKSVAESSGYEIVWLKPLLEELQSEGIAPRLSIDIIDRLLIARLEIDPAGMSDDLEFLPVIASLPAQQTVFEYLIGSWKRLLGVRSQVLKKGYTPSDTNIALDRLEKLRELLISYTGLTLQETEMFPQPSGRLVGPAELATPLSSMSSFTSPLLTTSQSSQVLEATDIPQFLNDLTRRFDSDDELEGVLGPVIKQLLSHPSLFRKEGLGGSDNSWRGVIGGLEALVAVKPIAIMITKMPEFIPENADAHNFEHTSLLGPLCRLGVFAMEWPSIAETYFSNPEGKSRGDMEGAFSSLRGTLKSLQSSLFNIFNTLVRASAESREAVLQYFCHVINLNVKRAGLQVDPNTVATDSFMVNLQCILYRFAENFIDASYSKLDRVDPLFYARSTRINISDETRIKATSEEASAWVKEHEDPMAPAPNFITNIFYIGAAMTHYGVLRAIRSLKDLGKHYEEIQEQLDYLQSDNSWLGGPMQARMQHAIQAAKTEQAKVRAAQLAYETQLSEPDFVSQSISFTNFLSTWLIRQADPKKAHPRPTVELPLPKEVPMSFRVLPEYLVEDIVDYLYFAVQHVPDKVELLGKNELLLFILTFLNSTWYIKNPFLKSKINDVLFMSLWQYGYERNGILGNMLNGHEMAIKHLMPTLMHFYIEVEQTGASSQFYDKFNARRNIAHILKVIWNNPAHREALQREQQQNVDRFVRFVNLMINDVTYLMDESLSDLSQMRTIQIEMEDREAWEARPREQRREREGTLRNLERMASSYVSLGRSTVELLKMFTAEAKRPFMMPEIVDRLAAMLDYNLVALVGPKANNLSVKDKEKIRFRPRELLSDLIQIFLNLSDQEEFIRAVANDGRSYSKEWFESAERIILKNNLKSPQEVEQLRVFVVTVEEAKANMEAEEELGEVPDEFLDPLMFTLMRDPVILPSSRTVMDRATIKSHLLSDAKDPFNRVPLTIEEVIPDHDLKARIDAFLLERRSKSGGIEVKPIGDVDMEV